MKYLTTGLVLLLSGCFCLESAAQEQEIATLAGAAAIEELDEDEYERLEAFRSAPMAINTASRTRLQSCGLFTRFQVLSLIDYRMRNGDILSLSELALIDGFSAGQAEALAPFLSFYSARTAGSTRDRRTKQELSARWEGHNGLWGYAAKYRISEEGRYSAGATMRSKARDPLGAPDSWSFNLTLPFRNRDGKWMLGDYNARFGQGLALWNGFSLGGLSAAESFARHPTGLSPAWSLSADGPLRGVAADLSLRRVSLSAMAAFPGLRARMDGDKAAQIQAWAAVNAAWTGRRAELSMTGLLAAPGSGLPAKLAADFRWTPGKLGFFGETAWDLTHRSVAAVGGLIWSPAYQRKVSLVLRHYPASFADALAGGVRSGSRCQDESGIAGGLRLPWLRLTADLAYFPVRGQRQARLVCIAPLSVKERISLTPRLSLRWRDGRLREEYRAEGMYEKTPWMLKGRFDLVHCEKTAWLSYAEAGYKGEKFRLYLRGGAFLVDDWDDRIYVYERDAPGCFNVPAYYGRGYSASLVGGLRWKRHKLYLRMAGIRYVTDKPRRYECRVQYNWSL